MLATKVYQILNNINKRKAPELDSNSVQFLQDKGLVSVMNSSDYAEKSADVSRLSYLRKKRDFYEKEVTAYQNGVDSILRDLSSRWHRIWTSNNKLKLEKGSLKETKKSLGKVTKKFNEYKPQVKRLESIKREIDDYVAINGVYIKPLELADERKKLLSARLPRLKDISYNEFEKTFKEVKRSISGRYNRFKKFYNFLIEKRFEEGDADVIRYALSLSGQKGTIEEVFEKARYIDDIFVEKFRYYDVTKSDYDRLKIIPVLMNLEGKNKQPVEELRDIFKIALKNDHSGSYQTIYESALNLRIPLSTAREKSDRFDKMGDELDKREWRKGSAITCYIAANLSKREGDVAAIAEEFRNLEKKLVKKGINDSTESGIAAMILMDSKRSLDERADRFKQAFKTMKKYGWRNYSDYYPAAAMISLMPKTIEENIQWLDFVMKKFEADGFEENLTYKSIPIIGGGYRRILKFEDRSYYEDTDSYDYDDDFSSYSSSITSSPLGFSSSGSLGSSFVGFGGGSSGGGGAGGSW